MEADFLEKVVEREKKLAAIEEEVKEMDPGEHDKNKERYDELKD